MTSYKISQEITEIAAQIKDIAEIKEQNRYFQSKGELASMKDKMQATLLYALSTLTMTDRDTAEELQQDREMELAAE